MSKQAATRADRLKMAAGIVAAAVLLALAALGLHALIGSKSTGKPKQPKISLMAPPPPPPPPPPKFEKKIEPPKETKEIRVDQPVQKMEPVAPSPELKMEGPAGDGPSAFASGAITSEDLSKVGNDKGVLGSAFNFNSYSIMLKSELQRYLSKNTGLRRQVYKVELRVWLSADGSLKKTELVSGSGDDETDEAIRAALAAAPKFSQVPPENMPQPVRLAIVSSGRH